VQAADHLIQGGVIHPAAHYRSGDSQLMHARHPVERGRRPELGLNRDRGQVPHVGERAGLHRLAMADDRHPVRQRLGLGQDVT